MADTENPVRKVQHHLRRAGTLLAQQQFDTALAEVDRALTIDPASLPAQALRERVVSLKAREPQAPPAPASTDGKRFVPSGVDAQTWLGFEQRIQERRFRALVDQIETAITTRDGLAARIAFEEARELRPEAPELREMGGRVMLLPMAVPAATRDGYGWSRAVSAVALLLAGVTLLIGIEWIRPVQVPSTAPAAIDAPETITPAPASVVPPPTAPAPTEIRRPEPIEPDAPRPVSTTGIRRAVSIQPSFRPARSVEARFSPRDGEVPDDYVAPEYRRPSYQGRAAVTRAPRQPFTVTPSPAPSSPATAALPPQTTPVSRPAASFTPSPSSIVPARVDDSGVTQALNQYARAYGRLDASAARAVWPSVDERALARAFADLQSQAVSFDNCNVNVRGAKATASCRGRASYVGKVGSREPRTEQRQWTFELRRDGNDAWKIETAQAQRLAYAGQ